MFSEFQIKEMQDIMLEYLTKDLKDVGYININLRSDHEDIHEFGAFTEYLGCFESIKHFEISYDKNLMSTPDNFIKVMAHELIHVMQYLRGDDLDFSLPYNKQLHEFEAYAKEYQVKNYYLSKIGDKYDFS